MNIASIYKFRAYPPRGGNHLHALQLILEFQRLGHSVLTLGDPSVPETTCYRRDRDGAHELAQQADVLYVRIDGNRLGDDPVLVELLESATKPVIWEINAPANEALAFSWLGGDRQPKGEMARLLDRIRRHRHAAARFPAIWREERLRRRLAAGTAAATCVSETLVRYAREYLRIPTVREVPNGADADRFRPDGPAAVVPSQFDGWLKAVYVGSPIYPWQGLDIIFDAMRRCAEAGDRVAFILLMNQEPTVTPPRENSLVFVGLPYDDVPAYIRAADVGLAIHPDYFWSKWGFHGSSMKLFEYMACGRPVVASNVGQLAQVIAPWRNGLLCANNGAALREALLKLEARRSELPAMGANARCDVEQCFNWKRAARDTIALFEQLLSR